jgi:hydrogenase maturation protease
MELLENYDRAIIIDAIQLRDGNEPGMIFTMNLDDLRVLSCTQHSSSAHDTSLVTALDAGKSMGMKLPEEISIFAVQVENILDFSEQMTPAVAATVSKVTEMVLDIL